MEREGAATSVEPKETNPSSRPTMKRGRSTEEPHPEAKKPSKGNSSSPPAVGDKPSEECGSPVVGITAPAVAPPTEAQAASTDTKTKKRRTRRTKKMEREGAATSVEPKETNPSSRPTMKRGRSTEEPHPEAKKPSKGNSSPPPAG
ncbi:uncharacterized protein LOC131803639 [Musca domestica]|uniref:Uncharacterized protein LOC131803639 n=1 Tax=Musca domestica TaxID=7370 RepID=A0ABM3V5J0_MUSDO|nr:uncharacterized protein LOC131803639 [Musca domestica]